MDVNNEMILMRKDIKIAKNFVIQKLIRKTAVLKKKRGTEKLTRKYQNRANNLLKEIGVIKDFTADEIFKVLITSDSSLSDFGNQQKVNLQERACVRIGAIPRISKRIKIIKGYICQFDAVRSKKETITSIEVNKKLSDLRSTETLHKTYQPPKKKNRSFRLKKISSQHCDGLQASSLDNSDNQASTISTTSKPTNRKILTMTSVNISNSLETTECRKSLAEKEHELFLQDSTDKGDKSFSCNCDEHFDNHSDSLHSDDIFTSNVDYKFDQVEKIQVVLPDFYANKTSSNLETDKQSKSLNDHYEEDDVTAILSNAGGGFADSDEEEQAARMKRWANMESDDDDFFVTDQSCNNEPSSSQKNEQLERLCKMNPIPTSSARDGDSKKLPKNKYFQTIFRQMNPKNSKVTKNSQMKKETNNFRGASWRSSKSRDGSFCHSSGTKQHFKNRSEELNGLHPSWQASKMKKDENRILQFSGTRIKFDDDD